MFKLLALFPAGFEQRVASIGSVFVVVAYKQSMGLYSPAGWSGHVMGTEASLQQSALKGLFLGNEAVEL